MNISSTYLSHIDGFSDVDPTDDPRGFNKGRSSKFREGSRVRKHLKKA